MDPSGRFVHGSMAAGELYKFYELKAQLYEPGKKRLDAFALVGDGTFFVSLFNKVKNKIV